MSEVAAVHPSQEPPGIPPRVQAAQNFLYYLRYKADPDNFHGKRPITSKDLACETAATDLLTNYFLGEFDLGDNPIVIPGHDDEEGDSKVPVLGT